MKKTILILSLLLACTFSSNAQNDATWEETIRFIEKYSSFLTDYSRRDGNISDFQIKNKSIYFINGKGQGAGGEFKVEIDLSQLKKVDMSSDGISLYFTGNYVDHYYYLKEEEMKESEELREYWEGSKVHYYWKGCFFEVNDSDFIKRLFKAFSHLAKLATEKREAERKASGDKF